MLNINPKVLDIINKYCIGDELKIESHVDNFCTLTQYYWVLLHVVGKLINDKITEINLDRNSQKLNNIKCDIGIVQAEINMIKTELKNSEIYNPDFTNIIPLNDTFKNNINQE